MPGPATLLIAYCFDPSTEPGALRAGRFHRYLPSHGYQPLVLTSTPQDSRPPAERVACVEAVIRPKFTVQGFLDRLLTRFVISADPGELRWVGDATAAAVDLHRQSGFSSVISTFPPLATHLVARRLKRKLGVHWVADFRDPLVDNPYRRSKWICAWVDQWIERQTFCHADAVIANTDAVLEAWKRRYPQYIAKLHLIWNGFDPAEQFAIERLPPPRRRVLAHIGAIYGNRHPRLVLESLHRLIVSGRVDPAGVQMLQQGTIEGDFEPYKGVREELQQRGVWIEKNSVVSKEEARRLQCSVDSLLLLDTPGVRTFQVPAKLFEYVRVGRPILACTVKGSPVDRLLAESGIPNVRIYFDLSEQEIDARLAAFLALPTDPVPMAPGFAEKFDGSRQTGHLARILNELNPWRL